MRSLARSVVGPAQPLARSSGLPRALFVLGAVLLLATGWTVATFNRLVQARQAVDAQWAQVESVYQRRADLIPNLVAATQGYLVQERVVFEGLAQARAAYAGSSPGSPDRVAAANQLQGAIGRLLAVIERYPELRSREVVLGLMDELAGTEYRIAIERRRYNEQVGIYNQLALGFPSSLVARAAGFRPRGYFQAEVGAATTPKTP